MPTQFSEPCAFRLRRIGTVHRNGAQLTVEIFEQYRPGLKQLSHFSHVWVLWWAHHVDEEQYRTHLQMQPPYAEDQVTGVFASRSPFRPNPIGLSVVLLAVVNFVVVRELLDQATLTPAHHQTARAVLQRIDRVIAAAR